MHKDNCYEIAVNCFTESLAALGPESVAKHQQPAMYHLVQGLCLLARGLLQESRELEMRLNDLAKRGVKICKRAALSL